MFFSGGLKPSIVSVQGNTTIDECGVCNETCWVVAKDKSTGWSLCQACVHDALTVDSFFVKHGKSLRFRHPRPKEFKGGRDR